MGAMSKTMRVWKYRESSVSDSFITKAELEVTLENM
jgi:hypothetical protein